MAQLLVRKVDDRLVGRLSLRARALGTSLEAKARAALEREWNREAEDRLARIRALAARTPSQPLGPPLAQDLAREDRDR